ncbi:hypothetical protein [Leptolyngbya sp. FACHB-261]|uniref:hypothetical protein n=1 Tax=Leptolyngbya sp. FACHB-261 TaxID=2692806 RepID=UPI001682602A|nr:hypothetical protein [Leptolyngbya sp. FACHB-261]MBD2104731.1 hypothetical protein [Leptolyngbya sp. FACHB-261]
MPANLNSPLNSPGVSEPAVINLISLYVYQAIVAVQQQQPELLSAKAKAFAWQERRATFIDKLAAELRKAEDVEELISQLKRILHLLLAPDFFGSDTFQILMERVFQLTYPEADSEVDIEEAGGLASDLGTDLSIDSEVGLGIGIGIAGDINASNPQAELPENYGMAVLLLDAENLHVSAEIENFLAQVCRYPLQVKVAFGNWRNLGRRDAELYSRGYELIHVPPGKNNADLKMVDFGSSILKLYPYTQEVLICSSDRIMDCLYTSLHQCGVNAYWIRRQGEALTVISSQTGETAIYTSASRKKNLPQTRLVEIDTSEVRQLFPSPEALILELRNLVELEQALSSSEWVTLSRLEVLFKEKYDLELSEAVVAHRLGYRAHEAFRRRLGGFLIHQTQDHSEVYVTLLPSSQPLSSQANWSPALLSLNSEAAIEAALASLIEQLTQQTSGGYIPISDLSREFNREYGLAITVVIRRLFLGKSLRKFLQRRPSFRLARLGPEWQVALVKF